MNAEYITRALNFHGQPMQKIWEDERGDGDLQRQGVPQTPMYNIYQERQKHFTFQDRAKRLKLHQFFSRKAVDLYDRGLASKQKYRNDSERLAAKQRARPFIAKLPPFEAYVNKKKDKFLQMRCLLSDIKPGDVVYGMVTKAQLLQSQPLLVRPLCTGEPLVRYLGNVTVKGDVPRTCINYPLDKNGLPRTFTANEYVCCEVSDVSVDADRINLTMDSKFAKNKDVHFGLVSLDSFPDYYKLANQAAMLGGYDNYFKLVPEFQNNNCELLYDICGLDINDTFSLMSSLRYPFPIQEYAPELRQKQANKWAVHHVAQGIEHFRQERHDEAFLCLNQALKIDPRNVEGLVARGALHANKGAFLKAVEDFEKALKINTFHANARKYMGETLVALGRSYQEENRLKEAEKAYRDCLNIIPDHEQALLNLQSLQQHNSMFDNLLNIPPLGSVATSKAVAAPAAQTINLARSSSDSDSDSDTDESNDKAKKESFMSPLSKRLHDAAAGRNQFSQPFFAVTQQPNYVGIPANADPNEFKLDDDDTEERVRKFLKKYKKEKSKKKKKQKKHKEEKKSATDFSEGLNLLQNSAASSNLISLRLYEESLQRRQELLDQSALTIDRLTQKPLSPKLAQQVVRPQKPEPTCLVIDDEEDVQLVAPPPPQINNSAPTTSTFVGAAFKQRAPVSTAPRFSFTIKRPPIKVDKFGLCRVATPLCNDDSSGSKSGSRSRSRSRSRGAVASRRRKSHSASRSRSRSRNRHRSRNRSRSHSRHSGKRRSGRRSRSRARRRSYSRSRSHSRSSLRRRRRTSRSRSRSLSASRRRRSRRTRSHSSSRSFSRSPHGRRAGAYSITSGGRRIRTPSPFVPRGTPTRSRRKSASRHRRTPSPFVPRGTPSPRSKRSTPSPLGKRGKHVPARGKPKGKRGGARGAAAINRVWRRPGYQPGLTPAEKVVAPAPSEAVDRWKHDKFVAEDNEEKPATAAKDDGPTIEEIDELVKNAQKERKEEIINRDKDILKKPT